MAEFYTWTKEELGLDVKEMDEEHQTLIHKMNALYASVQDKKSTGEIEKCINDLAEFTVKHFADEEAYMTKTGFAGLATHKIIHQQLLTQFKEHVDSFKKTQTVSQSFFNFLKVWLTGHIRGIDRKYADHAHKKKVA